MDNEEDLKKEAIGFAALAGIGAGLGLMAYGLEKSYGLLTGNKNISEVISGLNVDKKKVENFEKDLNEIISMAPQLRGINDAMDETISAYIKACQQMLPQMKAQIAAAEKEIAKKKSEKAPGKPEPAPSVAPSTRLPPEPEL